jgi:hypothetical protein
MWWTHYVTFCALAVVYVWEILQSSSSPPPLNGHPYASTELARLIDLAERCRNHLACSTAANSPSRRYSIILEELRSEAKSQSSMGSATAARVGGRRDVGEKQHQLASNDTVGGVLTETSLVGGPVPSFDGSQGNPHPAVDLFSGADAGGLDGGSNLLIGWQMSDWLDLDASVRRLLHPLGFGIPVRLTLCNITGFCARCALGYGRFTDNDVDAGCRIVTRTRKCTNTVSVSGVCLREPVARRVYLVSRRCRDI